MDGLANSEGAVGDPASLGIGAILLGSADWTSVPGITDGGQDLKGRYWDAAGAQVAYLLQGAPRYGNGAISQRVEGPEVWADFMSMVPPFLAYFGVATRNGSLVQESVRQCALYRGILQPAPQSGGRRGLWRHIIGPYNRDEGFWSTGNGWAVNGLARVLAVVLRAPGEMFEGVQGYSNIDEDGRRVLKSKAKCGLRKGTKGDGNVPSLQRQKSWWVRAVEAPWIGRKRAVADIQARALDESDPTYTAWLAHTLGSRSLTRAELVALLTSFIKEILDAVVFTAPLDSGLVRNYIMDAENTDGRGFGEVAGSALIASVVYRMAVVDPRTFGGAYVAWAEGIRRTLGLRDQGGGYLHVKDDGTVVPTVNPYWWLDSSPWMSGSPEAQSFVGMMCAAWRDCVGAGVCERP